MIGGLLFAVFILGSLVTAALLRPRRDEQNKPPERNYSQYPTNQDANNAFAFIATAEEIQRYRKETDDNEKDRHFRELVTAIAVWIYTAITAIIAIIYFIQSDIMKETEKVQARAFVFSDSIRLIQYGGKVPDSSVIDDNPRWVATPIIENSGNTPTRYLRYSVDTTFNVGVLTSESFERHNPYQETFSPSVIGPKSDITAGPFILGPNELNGLQFARGFNGKFLGAIGVVKYKDIFDDNHVSEFCYNVQVPPLDARDYPKGQPIRLYAYAMCEAHNCQDDECGQDWQKHARE